MTLMSHLRSLPSKRRPCLGRKVADRFPPLGRGCGFLDVTTRCGGLLSRGHDDFPLLVIREQRLGFCVYYP